MKRSNKKKKAIASVVDLFCGAGGLSHGFYLENIPVAAGIDIDEDCRYAYERNNNAPFLRLDVSSMRSKEIQDLFFPNIPKVLVGCAPCQPFSIYNQKNNDPNWKLLKDFAKLIHDIRPDVVSMENVPRLLKFQGGKLFEKFVNTLDKAGYNISYDIVYCPDYGLPQTRSRLVLLASKLGTICLPEKTHNSDAYSTVAEYIKKLPPIGAGGAHPCDPLHRSSKLSEINMQRIKVAKPGGTWRDWSDDLIVECHRKDTGRGYSSVYGRMSWNEPSPTITTQFYGFGNGRFGHPDQDRALSLREGAILQGFPRNYQFIEPGKNIHFKKIGRMIGNAVPVTLAQAIAREIKKHLTEHS